MGIKKLNRFLIDNCSKRAIHKIHLKELSKKTVTIDTSIYLYKFMGDNALMENMYLFISILKSYSITPIFVFEGKPPPEKKELLARRRQEKNEAKQKYMDCMNVIELETSVERKQELLFEIENLKKQFIKIKDEDICKVKNLMDCYGIEYYDAPGEADILCSYLVKTNKAWACLSDDMDMFLYGCNRVVRHISLLNHTAVYYDMAEILKDLQLDEKTFRDIMVLSGTDYNIHSNTSLFETIKWYYEYNKFMMRNEENEKIEFNQWLAKNTKYVDNINELTRINEMFVLENYGFLAQWNDYEQVKKSINMKGLVDALTPYGFIFV
jgi:XPG I-region/XPG N-terminal domain